MCSVLNGVCRPAQVLPSPSEHIQAHSSELTPLQAASAAPALTVVNPSARKHRQRTRSAVEDWDMRRPVQAGARACEGRCM